MKIENQRWHNDWLGDENGWILDANGNYLVEACTKDSEGRYVKSPKKRQAILDLMTAAPQLAKRLKWALLELEKHDQVSGFKNRAQVLAGYDELRMAGVR